MVCKMEENLQISSINLLNFIVKTLVSSVAIVFLWRVVGKNNDLMLIANSFSFKLLALQED